MEQLENKSSQLVAQLLSELYNTIHELGSTPEDFESYNYNGLSDALYQLKNNVRTFDKERQKYAKELIQDLRTKEILDNDAIIDQAQLKDINARLVANDYVSCTIPALVTSNNWRKLEEAGYRLVYKTGSTTITAAFAGTTDAVKEHGGIH